MENKEITPNDNFLMLMSRLENIDDVIEEYKCKVANNKDSEFWKSCLKIANQFKKKSDGK